MSQAKPEAVNDEEFSEADVARYLSSHPDFFERHLPLLRRLSIPHQPGSSTISLVERQVTVLRQRNDELEKKLAELIEVAKANNDLVDNIHKLAIALLKVPGVEARLELLENALREDFLAERAVLILFRDEVGAEIARPGFVKTIDRDDEALKAFSTFLRSARARCGSLRDLQKEFLFEHEADSIASGAMVPIGDGGRRGFLTVGSKDPNQFHAGQHVDFLARLGELVEIALDSVDESDVRG